MYSALVPFTWRKGSLKQTCALKFAGPLEPIPAVHLRNGTVKNEAFSRYVNFFIFHVAIIKLLLNFMNLTTLTELFPPFLPRMPYVFSGRLAAAKKHGFKRF